MTTHASTSAASAASARRPARVLVTGAAGMIGRAVLRALDAAGVPATALTLADPGDLPADRVVVGDATDPRTVAEGLTGADAVVHLAAIPAPTLAPAPEVFGMNTRATFTVLDAAGRAGIRRVAIASSINALGFRFSPDPAATPPPLPLDADSPTIAADPYSMSKWVDEFTAAALARRYSFGVVALRMPFVGDLDGRLLPHVAQIVADPGLGAGDLWLYLETRDAAAALVAALSPSRPGVHVLHITAPEVCVPQPTEALLAEYWPQVARRRRFHGREAPVDLVAAERLIGFRAQHLLPAPEPATTAR